MWQGLFPLCCNLRNLNLTFASRAPSYHLQNCHRSRIFNKVYCSSLHRDQARHLLHAASWHDMWKGHFPFWHPDQHQQSRCQEGLCFGAHHSWSGSNPFVSWEYLFLICGLTGLRSYVALTPNLQKLSSSLPGYFLPKTPWRTIFPSCSIEHIFCILCCINWPKGYCTNDLLFNLFKTCYFQDTA